MITSIAGKQFELTDSIKAYVQTAVDTLGKYNLDIISVRTVVSADENGGKKGFSIEFAINMAHKNTIVIQQKDKDVYAAIDLAIERAKKVLRRHHDKINSYKNVEGINALPVHEETEDTGSDDEIVEMHLDSFKPLEIEEAMHQLKDSDKQFFVFNDKQEKLRVMYKKTDGRFGLF